MNQWYIISLGFILPIIILGCASSPPIPAYTVPTDVPYALIKIENITKVWPLSISINENCKGENKFGVFVHGSSEYRKVAAQIPVRLSYFQMIGGFVSCSMSGDVILEQGKKYTLRGGYQILTGSIPILSDREMCYTELLEDENNIPIKLSKPRLCD